MKYFSLFALIGLMSGCSHQSGETWENMKTAGRYVQRGVGSMLGKEYESRMLSSSEDFCGPFDGDFIPLQDADLRHQVADAALPQPKHDPGQFGIPGLHSFHSPPEALRGIFSTVHFNTDEHVIRDRQETAALLRLSEHLKAHPDLYIVVIGHCDERASAAYNMALGMRRANAVRSFLIKNGADQDRVYTLSRGKEEPVASGHTKEDWKVNRRAEFKVHQR